MLDCPGGGLRIDTIHAFSQYLLAAFPEEAQVMPGARALEDRERDLLSQQVLADLLADAEKSHDAGTLEAVAELSRRKGPDGVRAWLMRCAGSMELWTGSASWQPPMQGRVNRLLGIPADADAEWLAEACSDAQFPVAAVQSCLAAMNGWNTQIAEKVRAFVTSWLAMAPPDRANAVDGFYDTLLKKDGEPRAMKGAEKNDPAFPSHQAAVAEGVSRVRERAALFELAQFLAPQLELGRRFALAWEEAKEREGLVDFDDLIRRAAILLSDAEMAAWIRYKLDRQFDHILIDEAQDTNASQWAIIDALTDDFFAGEGAHGGAVRTIFTVGDYKQAIFGFQGTSPENFRSAKERVAERMRRFAEATGEMRGQLSARDLQELDLGRSFRTADVVLRFVDKAIAAIGPENLGLDRDPPAHVGEDRPGIVTLWNTVIDGADDEGDGTEDWLARHDRQMADRLARQVRQWMDQGFPLVKGEGKAKARRATPGDVMILVRKRRELASLIVARLYTHGVPVAGVDRLRLGAPLAVKDLMAAIRFAAQPLDDLNLANLLVSPLIGWSQEDLLELAYRPKQTRLWEHIRGSDHPVAAQAVASLREILRRADFDAPDALLRWILTGAFDGRRKLVARLGAEANDPIDELLNAAANYAGAHTASLQGFIRWFDAGDGELKREAGEASDQVRVMTVHGSKGLQAPIVILADAAIGPDAPGELALTETGVDGSPGHLVPIPGIAKDQRVGALEAAYDVAAEAALQEHWRLLYVAMTRAEEALFIGGSLGPRDAKRGAAHEDSWHARLEPLFEGEPLEDPIWGARREWGALPTAAMSASASTQANALEFPDWAERMAPEEPRPPKPLAPSGLGDDDGSDPPLPPEHNAIAARRGVLIHALLERLPDVPQAEREARAAAWLEKQAPDLGAEVRGEMLSRALGVLAQREFADIFSPRAMAEIPLAATVGGQVVAGIADRLLVESDTVTVVDFKTARRPPAALEDIPASTVRQMAAYVAALEIIYPGRMVKAAVLYTQTPQLFELPQQLIEAVKSRFDVAQESFGSASVE